MVKFMKRENIETKVALGQITRVCRERMKMVDVI